MQGRETACVTFCQRGEALSWPKFHFHSNCPLFPPHLSAFRTSKLNWLCFRGFASFSDTTICKGGVLTNKNYQLWFSLSDLSSIGGGHFLLPLKHMKRIFLLINMEIWVGFQNPSSLDSGSGNNIPRNRIFYVPPPGDRIFWSTP